MGKLVDIHTENDIETIWLRTAALIMFRDVHCIFPWSILDYSPFELTVLFAFDEKPVGKNPESQLLLNTYRGYDYERFVLAQGVIGFTGAPWPVNPLMAEDIRKSIHSLNTITNAGEAVMAVIGAMVLWGEGVYCTMEEGSCHPASVTGYVCDTPSSCHEATLNTWSMNIAQHWQDRCGGCNVVASIMRAVLRAFNIPCINGTLYHDELGTPGAHYGVRLPSLGWVFASVDEIIVPGNPPVCLEKFVMPAELYLLSENELSQWIEFGGDPYGCAICRRQLWIRWMNRVDMPDSQPGLYCMWKNLMRETYEEPEWGQKRFEWIIKETVLCNGVHVPAAINDPAFAGALLKLFYYFVALSPAEFLV